MALKKRSLHLSKIVFISIFLNLTQALLIISFIYYKNKNPNLVQGNFIVNVAGISIAINSIITGVIFYNLLLKKSSNNLIAAINYLENLNITLKAQRHDYLNHIQVIYSLLELEEFQEARNYIEPVYKDIVRVSKALKTSKPAINALLQAKLQVAEKSGIELELEIKTDFSSLPMEPWEFCRVLGNIIDNAIFALKQKPKDRYMLVELSEDLENIIVNIKNNGESIPKEILKNIFKAGFTTKGDKGEGMGLAIVKELVEGFKGTIEVISKEEYTAFKLSIPKLGHL